MELRVNNWLNKGNKKKIKPAEMETGNLTEQTEVKN